MTASRAKVPSLSQSLLVIDATQIAIRGQATDMKLGVSSTPARDSNRVVPQFIEVTTTQATHNSLDEL